MENNKRKIDLTRLIIIVKKDWRSMCLYCLCTAILGLIIAFSTPHIYISNVMLAPESSSSTNLATGISSLASMVGMDIGSGNNGDAIYPEVYPDLIKSTDFLVSMFPVKIVSKDQKIKTTYYDYLKRDQKFPWWNYPIIFISKELSKLKSNNTSANNKKVDPFCLTKEQSDIAASISGNIDCQVDKKTSVISIAVTDQDPLIAALIADSAKQRLQAFITNYRTNKARNDLSYMEKLYNEAKDQYSRARQLYASYADANQELLLESYKSKEEDLENEMQLKYNIYTQVTEQLQLAKAKVQERTPAFTVVQSATVPVKHSNKPKAIVLLQSIMLGFIIRLGILVSKHHSEVILKES